jgi:hypothetical protein
MAEQDYSISILNTNYSKIKETTVGQDTIIQYDIFVSVTNLGNGTSDEIVITLTDDENFTITQEHTFDPMETKTITFENHPLTGTIDHDLTITYAPKNTSIQKTSANSGSKKMTITYDSKTNTDSPFIHSAGLITLFTLVALLLKKKKRF